MAFRQLTRLGRPCQQPLLRWMRPMTTVGRRFLATGIPNTTPSSGSIRNLRRDLDFQDDMKEAGRAPAWNLNPEDADPDAFKLVNLPESAFERPPPDDRTPIELREALSKVGEEAEPALPFWKLDREALSTTPPALPEEYLELTEKARRSVLHPKVKPTPLAVDMSYEPGSIFDLNSLPKPEGFYEWPLPADVIRPLPSGTRANLPPPVQLAELEYMWTDHHSSNLTILQQRRSFLLRACRNLRMALRKAPNPGRKQKKRAMRTRLSPLTMGLRHLDYAIEFEKMKDQPIQRFVLPVRK